jgi:hypothetical protein
MPSQEVYRVNWGEAFDYMQTIKNPVARNLIGIVYHHLVVNDQNGARPAAPFDLLFCFRLLNDAFENRVEVAIAAQGNEPSNELPHWF